MGSRRKHRLLESMIFLNRGLWSRLLSVGKIGLFLSLVTLLGCSPPTELKFVNWDGNQITWTVLDGGATTSYLWQIFFRKNESDPQKLIFKSYSSPHITDISLAKSELLIHCFRDRDSEYFITIDLTKVEDFIENPVEYERSILKRTNKSYREPEFVVKERQLSRESNL